MPLHGPSPRWTLAAAILISIVGAILRLLPLTESLWLDELHTAWCAVGPLSEVADRAAIGNQSPLYFWFQWLLVTFLGASEFSLRLPSLVAGAWLPLASFLLARRWHNEAAGLVAAVLIAVDPLCIFYATEARPYALVQLLAVMHVGLTVKVAETPTPVWRASWVAVTATLFHLHYSAALLIAAEAVFFAIVFLKQPNRLIAPLIDLAVFAALCLPALANLRGIFSRRANWAAFVPREPLWTAIEWTPLPGWWWLVLLVVAVIGVQQTRRTSPMAPFAFDFRLLVGCGALIPVTIAWLVTWTDIARLFFPRYLVVVVPLTALLAGLCILAAQWPWQRFAIGLLTIGISLWSSGMANRLMRDGRPIASRGEDWRGCVDSLNQQVASNRYPVLIWSGLIESNALDQPHDERLTEYCKLPLASLYELDIEPSDIFPLSMRQPGQLDPVAESLIVHRGGAWLVVRGERKVADQIATAIIASLRKSGVPESNTPHQLQEPRSFGRVHLLAFVAADQP